MKSETYKKESEFQRLRRNLKGLTFEQKVDHIFRYYWGTMVLIVLVPLILCFLIAPALRDKPDDMFAGVACNVSVTEEGKSYLVDDWMETLNFDPDALRVYLSSTTTAGSKGGYEIDGGVQVLTTIATNDLDYILCDEVSMEYFSVQMGFMPPEQVLDEETLAQWSDYIYYCEDEEEGVTVATGLDVSHLPFVKNCVDAEGSVYLMFAHKEEANIERLQLFFSYLNSWDEN